MQIIKQLPLSPGINVADIGSGPGRFSIPIAQLVKPGKVYAIDVDEESLSLLSSEAARLGVDNIEVIRADVTKGVPLPDSSIDLALMANVFHDFVHEGSASKVLSETLRVLKPEGLLAIVEFKKDVTLFGPPPWLRLSPDEVISVLSSNGFKLKDGPTGASGTHYILIFSK